MSMTGLTVLQLLAIFGAYLVITVIGPHWVVGKSIHYKNRYERFIMYSMLGNFYVMNLVYLLELLHISYRATLIFFTVVPCALIKIKLENIPVLDNYRRIWNTARKLTGGQLKPKAYNATRKPKVRQKRKDFRKKVLEVYVSNWSDVLLTVATIVVTFWMYGTTLLESYGYRASDMLVHNWWVNDLCENKIYTDGVYPYGFHVILYYIHSVFGIDTFVLMRLMSIVQTMWVILILLCFLKLECKSRYIPYFGIMLYTIVDLFAFSTYVRYASTLPQEYGIMFILPTAYCAIEYFRSERRSLRGDVSNKKYVYLNGLAISFAMTLSVHFYGTMVAGIFCMGIAIGYIVWFVRKPYFKRIMVTGLLSVIIAVMPMAIAYASGTELQGSLLWAMSIIRPVENTVVDNTDTEETESTKPDEPTEEEPEADYYMLENMEKYGKIPGLIYTKAKYVQSNMCWSDVTPEDESFAMSVIVGAWLMLVLGILIMCSSGCDKMYGGMITSCAAYLIMMLVMQAATTFGLPALMDLGRASIYVCFSMSIVIPLFFDAFIYYLTRPINSALVRNLLSFIGIVILVYWMISTGNVRKRLTMGASQSNDAIECLTSIIRDSEDYKWTICSANDEGQMCYGHGYHYELIDFLNAMEVVGDKGRIRIPTDEVFIYVEKYPIDYFMTWEGSNTPVSEEYAKMYLPYGRGIGIYYGINRWIVMSRLQAWAEAFMNRYPNEMTVYYETDTFICYKIVQNPYRLFNFAIDYGYNVRPTRVSGE